ncbi:MAG TPA: hypothetical protein VN616_02265 [Puia sp.]|nr:hypothetical protein [Puia sp.]
MKKIILGICVLSACALMCASARAMDPVRVPLKVRAEFHHEYKNVSGVSWKVRDGRYDVSFRKDGSDEMARYDNTGHRIDTRAEVPQASMPVKAIGHLEKKYPGEYSHTYTRIARPWKKDLYMVKVKDHGTYRSVYVDKNGHEHQYMSR